MENKTKYFTSQQISDEYEALSNEEKINILNSALGFMSQHNGRSKFLCKAMGMGYDNYEDESDTYFKS